MKKIVFFVLGIVLILSIFSCDRFKHHFDPEFTAFEKYLERFTDHVENGILYDDVASIMSYYSDTYLNNGIEKSDMDDFYSSLADASPDSIVMEIDLLSEADFKVSYRIKTAGVDTTIIDYAQALRDSFLFIGNQVSPTVPQKVLVESFTAITCPGCHYAEEALQQLKQEYGDDFYYIEYHWNDTLDVGARELMDYYNMGGSIPQSMFQGQVKVVGGGDDTYTQYHNTILTFFDQDALAQMTNISYTLTDTLFGQVTVKKEDALPLFNLYLKFALVEKVSSATGYTGRPCEQVVIAKGMKDISNEDLEQSVSFTLEMPQTIPDDIVLYIWLQTLADPYNSDTCVIYNVIEEDISSTKGGAQ